MIWVVTNTLYKYKIIIMSYEITGSNRQTHSIMPNETDPIMRLGIGLFQSWGVRMCNMKSVKIKTFSFHRPRKAKRMQLPLLVTVKIYRKTQIDRYI